VQRRQQLGGRLAVEGAAAIGEEARLGDQRRVSVKVEESALEVDHLLRPMVSAALLVEDVTERVVVAQVVRGHGAKAPQGLEREPDVRGDRRPVDVEQLRQAILAVHAHGTDPAQVVQADVLELNALGIDAEACGQAALERDRHVAQTDRPVPGVEERLGHDPHRVGEIHDPCAGGRSARRELRQLEDHRNGAQRLRESAGPGRLLADGVEAEGERLIDQAGGLTADTQLHEHEAGAVDRGGGIVGIGQASGPADVIEHPPR
jgi:hypothetical protein